MISHGSTVSLRDPHLEPQTIGRKLNARYLVLGRVRRGGDRLRLTTELTEAESGQIIYSHTDDVDVTLSFDDQDRIVARLVNALVPQVRETELRRIRGQRPAVLSVYEKILIEFASRSFCWTARISQKSENGSMRLSRKIPATAKLMRCRRSGTGTMAGEGWSPDRAGEIAAVERLNRTALELDNCNLRALVSYGYRKSIYNRDHGSAVKAFHQALDVAPCSAPAWALSGLCYAFAGDAAEAVRRATRAFELSPFDREAYKFYHALCVAHYTDGNYAAAADWGYRALSERSVWRATMSFTAASLAALGRTSDARDIVEQLRTKWKPRRVCEVMASVAYRDPERVRLYGEHMRAAGTPD